MMMHSCLIMVLVLVLVGGCCGSMITTMSSRAAEPAMIAAIVLRAVQLPAPVADVADFYLNATVPVFPEPTSAAVAGR